MSKRLLTFLVVLVASISSFSSTQITKAQLIISGGCEEPLKLVQTTGGPECRRLYTDASQLPPGCTNPSDPASVRLGYANTVRSVECQPQSGYSIALPGAINPDGTLKCQIVNGDGSVVNVPIGWNMMPGGTFQWNGGCGAFSASYDAPLPKPTGGLGVMPNSVDRCDAAQSIANGNPINITTLDGTGSGGLSRIEPATNMSGREACLAVSYQNSCNLTTTALSIDSKFDLGTCCSKYLVDTGGNGDNRCNATGGSSGGASNTGGAATPWNGTNGGTGVNTSLFNYILNNQNTLLSPTVGGGSQVDTSSINFLIASLSRSIANLKSTVANTSNNAVVPTVAVTGNVSGYVTVTVAHLNVRSTPSSTGDFIGQAKLGDIISVVSSVVGESVEGVSRWWKTANGNYIWSGGTTFPAPTAGGTGGGNLPPIICEYPAPPQGCSYISGPNYNSTTSCGLVLSCSSGGTGVGTNPQLSSTILTKASSGSVLRVGEAWVVSISGGAKNTPVYVVGGRGGAQDKTQMGTTDANGNFTLSGTFKTADIGSWSETWMVGNTTVKSFSFVVASAYVNDLFAHSIKFAIGQRVKTVSALNVRATPGTSGTLLGTQPAGAVGTFEGGTYGTYADGYYWWKINYDTGVDGWSVEDYLVDSVLNIGPTPASSIGGVGPVVDTSSGTPPPPATQLPPPFLGTNSNIGVYFWGGSLTSPGGNIITTGASLVKNIGIDKIRITLSSKADVSYKNGSCITNSSLVDLAKRSDFTSIFSDPQFKTIMITAYDWNSFPDCKTENFLDPTFMTSSVNIDKIKNEYKDLAIYLKSFPNKKFIISNWEGDNSGYCLSAYGATASSCPSYALRLVSFKIWVGAYADGIRLANANNVYSAVEFNIVRDLKSRGMPSVLYDVAPSVNTDYISYSSYESINHIWTDNDQGATLSADIPTILSVTGKSIDKLIIGEYGFGYNSNYPSRTAINYKNELKIATDIIESKGIKDYFVWALFNDPAGFELYSPNGVLSESGKYVCTIAGGANCN